MKGAESKVIVGIFLNVPPQPHPSKPKAGLPGTPVRGSVRFGPDSQRFRAGLTHFAPTAL
jgi:hypothetical protein